MGNCLKTQLKSTVENDNLYPFGVLRVKFADSESYPTSKRMFNILSSAAGAVMTIHNGYFSGGSTTAEVATSGEGGKDVILTGAGAYLDIANPYTLTKLQFIYGEETVKDISPTGAINGLTLVQMKTSRDISDNLFEVLNASKDSLTVLTISSGSVFPADISKLNKFTNLGKVTISNVGITGDIVNLAPCNKLVSLLVHDNSGLSGSVEKMCNAMNRSDGLTLTMQANGTNVLLKNVAAPNYKFYITFTSPSDIVIKNGTDVSSTVICSYNGTNWLDDNGNPYTPA